MKTNASDLLQDIAFCVGMIGALLTGAGGGWGTGLTFESMADHLSIPQLADKVCTVLVLSGGSLIAVSLVIMVIGMLLYVPKQADTFA